MDFKSYISSLFYLNEVLKYANEEFKNKTAQLIKEMCDSAYEQTKYSSFKIYNEMKTTFPSINLLGSFKDSLKKTSITLWINRDLGKEEARIKHNQEEKELTINDAYVVIRTSFYANYGTETKQSTRITIEKMKNYNKDDLQIIIDELKNLGY